LKGEEVHVEFKVSQVSGVLTENNHCEEDLGHTVVEKHDIDDTLSDRIDAVDISGASLA